MTTENEDISQIDDKKIRVLLEELHEVGENTRHYDKMMVQWCTIFLGITIMILSLTITYFDLLSLFALTGLVFFSVCVGLVTLLVVARATFFKTIGFERAKQIEEELGLYYYRQIQEKRVRTTSDWGNKYTTTELGISVFIVFLIVWIALIVIKVYLS